MGPIYSISDFLDMLRRRVWLISFVVILGCMVSVYVAATTPHMYRSSEVIQIEQPKIDRDLAPTTVAGSSARRLQLIEQQMMSRSSLAEIIEKLGLYQDSGEASISDKVNLLRQSVRVTGVAAVREGFADDGTIAVLTFTAEMGTPEAAQAVAHEFADRTRALSAAQRQEQTEDTLRFFAMKEESIAREIAALEEEQTRFRSENDLSIEGSLEFRRSEIGSLNSAILALDRDIIAAQLARNRIDRQQRAETIARQEEELDAQLDSLTTQRTMLEQRRTGLNESIQTTPAVERALANFERRMSQLQGQMDLISSRRSEAEVGLSLENTAQGERLITIEEAMLPEYPFSSSRKKLVIMGAVASTFMAIALAFLMELRHPVLRTARQMERETGLLPVISIPDIRGKRPRQKLGWSKLWKDRREAGQRGRSARRARQYPDFPKG